MSKYTIQSRITNITCDSRKVGASSLFLAYPGEKSDGRDFIIDAINNGASAILWDSEGFAWNPEWQIENIPVKKLRLQAGFVASQFYKNPSQKLWVIGVTGTNGKTSITQWLAECFNHLNQKTAVIGTLGNGLPNQLSPAVNTTPDAILLQEMFALYVNEKAEVVAMEVSSHGLSQGRVNGVSFDIAVLSNLTQDHLDYHGTFEAYADAKRSLFTKDGLQYAVLNTDDAFGQELEKLLAESKTQVITYGIDSGQVKAVDLRFEDTYLVFYAETPYGSAPVKANLIGRFNVYNVLAVLATMLVSKVGIDDAVKAISHIKSAKGRMQQLGGGAAPLIVIDYAHTPDALEKVLITLKAQAIGKVICIFGCGGDRDKSKRALMGKIASDLANAVVVTSDNPRSENYEKIIEDIAVGLHGNFAIEGDRAKAISVGIFSAKPGDIVLIAGKGHEEFQEVNGKKFPFSDLEEAKEVLKIYGGKF